MLAQRGWGWWGGGRAKALGAAQPGAKWQLVGQHTGSLTSASWPPASRMISVGRMLAMAVTVPGSMPTTMAWRRLPGWPTAAPAPALT